MNYLLGKSDVTAPNGRHGQTGASEGVDALPSATFLLANVEVVNRRDGLFVWTDSRTTIECDGRHADGANIPQADTKAKRSPNTSVRLGGNMRIPFKLQPDEG